MIEHLASLTLLVHCVIPSIAERPKHHNVKSTTPIILHPYHGFDYWYYDDMWSDLPWEVPSIRDFYR